MSWAVIRQSWSRKSWYEFVVQQFFDVTMQASRVPVHFSEKCNMPVPMPEPVPDLRRPVRDVGSQDDYAIVSGLAGLGLD